MHTKFTLFIRKETRMRISHEVKTILTAMQVSNVLMFVYAQHMKCYLRLKRLRGRRVTTKILFDILKIFQILLQSSYFQKL